MYAHPLVRSYYSSHELRDYGLWKFPRKHFRAELTDGAFLKLNSPSRARLGLLLIALPPCPTTLKRRGGGNRLDRQAVCMRVNLYLARITDLEWESRVLTDLGWNIDPDPDVLLSLAYRSSTYDAAYSLLGDGGSLGCAGFRKCCISLFDNYVGALTLGTCSSAFEIRRRLVDVSRLVHLRGCRERLPFRQHQHEFR